ncbi:MAG TPA: SPW repeat protein [Chryseolinea sp.]|nr:SPW repeat protein [Chryseolinea sp.]
MDYLYGIVLIALPWALGFSQYSGALWVMFMLGIVTIIFSLMTRYEMGYVGLISMKMHLWFDLLMGIFLLASPWLLGFASHIFMPHVIMGCISIVVALTSRDVPTNVHGPQLTPDRQRS